MTTAYLQYPFMREGLPSRTDRLRSCPCGWGILLVHCGCQAAPQKGMQRIVIENSPVKTDTNARLIGG
jgi:hypothetical protein